MATFPLKLQIPEKTSVLKSCFIIKNYVYNQTLEFFRTEKNYKPAEIFKRGKNEQKVLKRVKNEHL